MNINSNKEILQKLAACAAACEACMDACLSEEDVKNMVGCIRTDRDCAKICMVAASFIASNSDHAAHVIKECQEICRLCAEECEQHDMDHCQECARACREAERACISYQSVLV